MIILLLLVLVKAKFLEDNHVWVLDSENFDEAISHQQKLLVEFYAPWCDHCKQLAPEYSKAAEALKKHKIHIAKIDGSANKDLTTKYKIKGYPTLIYFYRGAPIEYTGMRTSDSIIEWVLQRQQEKIYKLSESESLEPFISNSSLILTFFGNISDSERSIFEFASINVKDFLYYETSNPHDIEKFNISAPKIVVFQYGQPLIYDLPLSTLEIMKYLEKLKPAKVHEFNQEAIRMIFDYQSPAFFYLRPESEAEEYKVVVQELAEKYKELLIFTVCDLNTPGNPKKLSQSLGVQPHEQPISVIINFDEAFNKYKSNGRTLEQLTEFVEGYKKKELSTFLKSQPVPEIEFENAVKVVTGNTYEDVINDPNKDVLVLYYSPEHPKCKQFLPIFERIAKDTRSWEGFLPCKFDLETNEAQGLKIKIVPHLRLFTKDNKEGIVFTGEFTKGGVKAFLREMIRKDQYDL